MSKWRTHKWLLALASLGLLVFVPSAHANSFTVTITVDENGNGTFANSAGFFTTLPSTLQADPGPGGLASALTYSMLNPPGLTAGDVLLQDAGGVTEDVIRFNPSETCVDGSTGCLVFYSFDASGALGDTGPPGAFYANNITIVEVGNNVSYTPTAGQPGFVAGAGGPVTFDLTSEDSATVPEPGTAILLGPALAGLVGRRARRKR